MEAEDRCRRDWSPHWWIIIGATVLFVSAPVYNMWVMFLAPCHDWDPSSWAQSLERGEEIVGQIERHIAQHGAPPRRLADLESASFRIRSPVSGTKRWKYRVLPDGAYTLSFHCPGEYPIYYFTSRKGEWIYDG